MANAVRTPDHRLGVQNQEGEKKAAGAGGGEEKRAATSPYEKSHGAERRIGAAGLQRGGKNKKPGPGKNEWDLKKTRAMGSTEHVIHMFWQRGERKLGRNRNLGGEWVFKNSGRLSIVCSNFEFGHSKKKTHRGR